MERWSILILPGDGPKTKRIRIRKKEGRSGSKEIKELTIQQSAVAVIVNWGRGYGIFNLIGDNATSKGRAKNRRLPIEILGW